MPRLPEELTELADRKAARDSFEQSLELQTAQSRSSVHTFGPIVWVLNSLKQHSNLYSRFLGRQ